MISARSALILILAPLAGLAQQPGPALSIDAAAGQHAISPDVYGINYFWDLGNPVDPNLAAIAPNIRPTARRWSGDNSSSYNWRFDVMNLDSDWFFQVLVDDGVGDASQLPAGSSFNSFVDQARVSGGKTIVSVP